ncbi:MlaD family protein [Nocardia nova]|uniref:MlaD family protein n=1 Tax=Nocardia nova TaxID=37330 RepID=UPI0033F31EF2
MRQSALALVAALTLGGCGFDPSSIPIPGTGLSGPSYPVRIEFADALNLPTRAKVFANGAQVGTVTGVHVVNPVAGRPGAGHVEVEVDIRDSVRLPLDTRAELRQNTVLGDIHIALTAPPGAVGARIAADGVIPLDHTRPPNQLEDIMSALAVFVQGGAVDRFQDIVNQMNAALPADTRDTARIANTLGGDLIDLGGNLDAVGRLLDGLERTATAAHDTGPILSNLLTDKEVRQIVNAAGSLVQTLGVFGEIGNLAHALEWAAPLLRSYDAAARAFAPLAFTGRPFDLAAPSNLNLLVNLLRDKIIPFAEHGPRVDITGVRIDGAAPMNTGEQVQRIIATLRMIGAVR